jgi:hypothetical protein
MESDSQSALGVDSIRESHRHSMQVTQQPVAGDRPSAGVDLVSRCGAPRLQ